MQEQDENREGIGDMEKRKKKRTKIILASSAILLIIGYLIYAGIRDTMTYYLTVSEVIAGNGETGTGPIRIGGTVSPSSVKWDPRALHLAFEIGDGKSNLEVLYKGVVPDSFKPGGEVVLEGVYQKGGKFVATAIMPKCASKYE